MLLQIPESGDGPTIRLPHDDGITTDQTPPTPPETTDMVVDLQVLPSSPSDHTDSPFEQSTLAIVDKIKPLPIDSGSTDLAVEYDEMDLGSPPTEIQAIDYQISVLQKTLHYCAVCKWPDSKRKNFESKLILGKSTRPEICAEFRIQERDIEFHATQCIINRQAIVPKEALLKLSLYELTTFIQILQRYKETIMDGDMSPETMLSYSTLMQQLRTTINSLMKIESPQERGININRLVISPLTIETAKNVIQDAQITRDRLIKHIGPQHSKAIKDAFNELVTGFGVMADGLIKESQIKLSEVLGVKVEDIT